MECDRELEEFRKALHRLSEVGLDPFYPGASLRDAAETGTLTREMLDAFVEYSVARRRLIRCSATI